MNKLFNIGRTKMIDEAAYMHKPATFGKIFWPFLLVFMGTNLFSGLIVGLVTTVYDTIIYTKNGIYGQIVEMLKNGDSYKDVMTVLEENPVSTPWWMTYVILFSSAITIVGAIYYCKKVEKRPITSMGLRKNGVALEIILGLLIGLCMVLAMTAILHFSGAVKFFRNPFDQRIFRPSIVLFFLGFLVQAVSEELLYRGFFLTSLSRDIRPIFSALICALVYSVFNFSSVLSFINAFLFAFLLNVYVLKRGSLWGSIMIRFVWLFTESAVLGTTGELSALFLPAYKKNMLLLTGEYGYGLGDGLLSTAVLIFVCALLLLLKTKKSERSAVEIEYFN